MSIENTIASHLPARLRGDYEAAFTDGQSELFEMSLDKVRRFDSHPLLKMLKNGYKNSDLDHVEGILDIVTEVEEKMPSLSAEVNMDEVRFMAVGHDTGEIYTDDVPSHGDIRDDPVSQRKKRLEPYCAIMILRNIKDPQVRARALGLLDRYEKQLDKEAILAKLLDKIDGDRTAVKHVFNYKAKGYVVPPDGLELHVIGSMTKLINRSLTLQKILSKPAQEEMSRFILANIISYRDIGYPELADLTVQAFLMGMSQIDMPLKENIVYCQRIIDRGTTGSL